MWVLMICGTLYQRYPAKHTYSVTYDLSKAEVIIRCSFIPADLNLSDIAQMCRPHKQTHEQTNVHDIILPIHVQALAS